MKQYGFQTNQRAPPQAIISLSPTHTHTHTCGVLCDHVTGCHGNCHPAQWLIKELHDSRRQNTHSLCLLIAHKRTHRRTGGTGAKKKISCVPSTYSRDKQLFSHASGMSTSQAMCDMTPEDDPWWPACPLGWCVHEDPSDWLPTGVPIRLRTHRRR